MKLEIGARYRNRFETLSSIRSGRLATISRIFKTMVVLMVSPIVVVGSAVSFAEMNLDFFNLLNWSEQARLCYGVFFLVALVPVSIISFAKELQGGSDDE